MKKELANDALSKKRNDEMMKRSTKAYHITCKNLYNLSLFDILFLISESLSALIR